MVYNERGARLSAYAIVMIIVATVAIILRFWSRAVSSTKRGSRFWWDDWAALAGLPFTIVSIALVLYMISLGLGKHVTEMPPENQLKQLKALYVCYVLYDTSITFPKTSALLFYARIFGTQSKPFKYALWFTQFLVLGWLISIIMLGVFLCDPVQKQFNPTVPGHCLPNSALWLGSAIPSVVIDLILLLLPLPMLWRLQMRRSRRILIMTVFIFGYCVIVISLGRLITVISTTAALNKDLTYASVPTFYWLCAEGPVSILSICLPSIFFLGRRLVRYGPSALFSSSTATSQLKMVKEGAVAKNGGVMKKRSLPSKASEDVELGRCSSDSTQGIFTGGLFSKPGQAYDVSATKTSSMGSSDFQNLSEIPAIHVRNDVHVQSHI